MMVPRRSRLPVWARRLGIGLAALLLLGIAGEVLLRLHPRLDPQSVIRMQVSKGVDAVYAPDPELGARLAPSLRMPVETLDYAYTLQTDHAGFPNPEPWPSRIDVAVLGDSLLEGPGLGLDGELTALLEQRLGGRSALNFALPGAGTEHQYRLYRRYAKPLRPKLVVALLWVTWDIDNSLHFDRWLGEKSPDPDYTHYRFNYGATRGNGPDEVGSGLATVTRFLRRQLGRSALLRTAHRSLESLPRSANMREQVVFPNGDTILLSFRDQQRLAQGIDRAAVPDMREVLFRPLQQLRTEVEEQGGRFVVVLMPSKEELYGADDYPAVLRPVRELRAGLEERGLPVLDLYPVFRERGQEQAPFYRADPHPNAFGTEIIADALAGWITDQNVFPARATTTAGAGADQ